MPKTIWELIDDENTEEILHRIRMNMKDPYSERPLSYDAIEYLLDELEEKMEE